MPTTNPLKLPLQMCPINRSKRCAGCNFNNCKVYADYIKNERFESKCEVTKKGKGDHKSHRPEIEVCSNCFTVLTNFVKIELKLCDDQMVEQLKLRSKSELKLIMKRVSNG